MDRVRYRISLNTAKTGYQHYLQGAVKGEAISRDIVMNFTQDGRPFEFPSSHTVTAVLYIKYPGIDEPSVQACEIDYDNSSVIYTLSSNDVAESGVLDVQLKLIDITLPAQKVLIAPRFQIEVQDTNVVDDEEAEQTDTYTALETALAQAQTAYNNRIVGTDTDSEGHIIFIYGDGHEEESDAAINAMGTIGQELIAEAQAKIDSMEDIGAGIIASAQGSADNASEYASASAASAAEASGYLASVEASASAASQSASEASTSASNASASASDASASATSASESATSASSSASSASASATSASESATSASSSATSASASATSAAESAESASTSESNASSSASSASASATNAATSESNASASATSAAESATEASGYLASVIANSDMAEAWANGTIGGSPVPSTHPAYHNNAEYWKDQAEQIAGGEDLVKYTQQTRSSEEKAQARENIGAMASSDRGVANGVASLDAGGRIPYSQLPESAMEYKGSWNASTNTPTLTNGVGTNGDFYIVSVGGTWGGTEFFANDRIIYDGTTETWQRIGGGNVTSVAGKTGAVTLVKADVGLNNVNNTADLNKPISNATQTALNAKADLVSNPTTNNFVALTAEGNIKDSGKKASDFASASSITAGTIGTSSSTSGSSLSVPYVTVSAQGVVTGYGTHTHTVTGFASSSHNQAASTITAGTLGGRVQANASAASTLGNAQVRDIYATTTDLTAGTSSLSAGSICLVYEA